MHQYIAARERDQKSLIISPEKNLVTHTESIPIATPIARPHLPDCGQFMELVAELFESRKLSNFGKYSQLLEQRAATALGHPSPLCVANCDMGLTLAWRALGCHSGEVIVPSFTFCSTVNALSWNGLTPVFADIDPLTFCLNPEDVRRRITSRTVGIAPVHTYGCPAPIAELEAIAMKFGLKTVYDAAHGLGASYRGQGLGAFGDASAFSLSGTKLVTGGEGGLVTFRDPGAAERFRLLRAYGFAGDYNCKEIGLNGKLSELNAALGWLSLDMLLESAEKRHEQVRQYKDELADSADIYFQHLLDNCAHGYKDFAILFRKPEQRADAEAALARRGVQTKRYFFPAHRMAAYANRGTSDLSVTDHIYERVLCLPIYFDLQPDEIHSICRVILNAIRPPHHRIPKSLGTVQE
jgi:dTDP-4-amino-4,6-dideoxygalactose transaminase